MCITLRHFVKPMGWMRGKGEEAQLLTSITSNSHHSGEEHGTALGKCNEIELVPYLWTFINYGT